MRVVIVLAVLISFVFAGLSKKEVLGSVKTEEFHSINYTEYKESEKLFLDLLYSRDLNYENFTIERKKDVLIIKEREKRGQGVTLYSKKGKNTLQMPHCMFDTYTCSIGWKLFFENTFLVAQFSSAHRYTNSNSDLAHSQYNHFTAFASAYGKYNRDGYLIQIHGFSNNKRVSQEGKEAEVIVSSGERKSSDKAISINECLKKKGFNSFLYPLEINELGGTKNASKKVLKELLHQGFIHIELNLSLRKQLLKSKKLRREFGQCLN